MHNAEIGIKSRRAGSNGERSMRVMPNLKTTDTGKRDFNLGNYTFEFTHCSAVTRSRAKKIGNRVHIAPC